MPITTVIPCLDGPVLAALAAPAVVPLATLNSELASRIRNVAQVIGRTPAEIARLRRAKEPILAIRMVGWAQRLLGKAQRAVEA